MNKITECKTKNTDRYAEMKKPGAKARAALTQRVKLQTLPLKQLRVQCCGRLWGQVFTARERLNVTRRYWRVNTTCDTSSGTVIQEWYSVNVTPSPVKSTDNGERNWVLWSAVLLSDFSNSHENVCFVFFPMKTLYCTWNDECRQRVLPKQAPISVF